MINAAIFRGSPDYDVVVYLNDVTPGEEVLRYFRNFIHRKLNVKRDKIKMTPHSLQFKLDGVEFDLLFAKNEVDPQSSGNFSVRFLEKRYRMQNLQNLKKVQIKINLFL